MVDKIKHIFIVLVLSKKSVFKHKKTCCTQHTEISMGPQSICPACPCLKTALSRCQPKMSELLVSKWSTKSVRLDLFFSKGSSNTNEWLFLFALIIYCICILFSKKKLDKNSRLWNYILNFTSFFFMTNVDKNSLLWNLYFYF